MKEFTVGVISMMSVLFVNAQREISSLELTSQFLEMFAENGLEIVKQEQLMAGDGNQVFMYLFEGVSYHIAVIGDNRIVEMDLLISLYNEENNEYNEVLKDHPKGNYSLIKVVPERTGFYLINPQVLKLQSGYVTVYYSLLIAAGSPGQQLIEESAGCSDIMLTKTSDISNGYNALKLDWYTTCNEIYGILPSRILSNEELLIISESTQVLAARLSWYENVLLIRLADKDWRDGQRDVYFLYNTRKGLNIDQRLTQLSGKSDVIHKINADENLQLDGDNADDYLRFFCFFLRGDDGPFYLVESSEDPMVRSDSTNYQALKEYVKPLRYLGEEEGDGYLFEAIIYYSGDLYESTFSVGRSGFVEMLNDRRLTAGHPINVNNPMY